MADSSKQKAVFRTDVSEQQRLLGGGPSSLAIRIDLEIQRSDRPSVPKHRSPPPPHKNPRWQPKNAMAHSPFKSPTPVGDLLLTAPLLGPFDFKADCARPGRWTQAAAALLDTWVPWLGYLGLGIGLQDFALGSFVAGAAAACGLGFQAYRCVWVLCIPIPRTACVQVGIKHDHSFKPRIDSHCVQKTLRIWPKVNPLVLSLTWMGNAVFALLAPAETLARYTLFVVISGALLGNALSLTMGRPVLLEEAMESVESRVRDDMVRSPCAAQTHSIHVTLTLLFGYAHTQEEAAHPRFARMHTRASFALLALACVQWPSFFLAAFVFYGNAGACAAVDAGGLIDTLRSSGLLASRARPHGFHPFRFTRTLSARISPSAHPPPGGARGIPLRGRRRHRDLSLGQWASPID